MKQVVFDTDIGIDDALALLYLNASPGVELRAIVTGFGNASVGNTTRNALYTTRRFGIDVSRIRSPQETTHSTAPSEPDSIRPRASVAVSA